jgi:hypothetical protein
MNMLDAMVNEVLRKDGIEALTPARIEGIKEMVTIYLWDSGFTRCCGDTHEGGGIPNFPTSRARRQPPPPTFKIPVKPCLLLSLFDLMQQLRGRHTPSLAQNASRRPKASDE